MNWSIVLSAILLFIVNFNLQALDKNSLLTLHDLIISLKPKLLKSTAIQLTLSKRNERLTDIVKKIDQDVSSFRESIEKSLSVHDKQLLILSFTLNLYDYNTKLSEDKNQYLFNKNDYFEIKDNMASTIYALDFLKRVSEGDSSTIKDVLQNPLYKALKGNPSLDNLVTMLKNILGTIRYINKYLVKVNLKQFFINS